MYIVSLIVRNKVALAPAHPPSHCLSNKAHKVAVDQLLPRPFFKKKSVKIYVLTVRSNLPCVQVVSESKSPVRVFEKTQYNILYTGNVSIYIENFIALFNNNSPLRKKTEHANDPNETSIKNLGEYAAKRI